MTPDRSATESGGTSELHQSGRGIMGLSGIDQGAACSLRLGRFRAKGTEVINSHLSGPGL